MTTSLYAPAVVVEIAFDSGFGTPTADRTWTDVSEWVMLEEGISITWGRQNERSQADANQLALVLDNSDGRFTAERVTSPYYPNVKLDRPIRVRAIPVDGDEMVEFLGYVNQWPVEWDGTEAAARASITASSRLARLGYTAALKSIVEQAILADGPAAYYTLGEPEGATQANDASGSRRGPLTPWLSGTPVQFGTATGPATDGLTAAMVTGGEAGLADFTSPVVPAGLGASFEMFFLAETPPPFTVIAAQVFPDPGTPGAEGFVIGVTASGYVVAAVQDSVGVGVSATTSESVCDNHTHHLAVVADGADLRVYVDGVEAVNAAHTGVPAIGSVYLGGSSLTFTAAHLAAHASALTPAAVASHASAGLTGYAGETTDQRLERYASYATVPVDEIDAEPGSTTMAHVDTTDQQVVELMRTVEATEGGVLFDARDGTLTMHNRGRRYVVGAAFLLDMGQHMVEASYQPMLDRTYLLNDVTAANVAGTVTTRQVDAQSRNTDYGPVTASITTASDDDDAPLQAAAWLVFAYKDPRVRVPSCGVNALAQVGKSPSCADVMAVTVGDKITIGGHPQQASFSSVDYFVEGGTRVYGLESLDLTWNLSPTSPWDQTLILGDPYRGFLGTNPLAY